MQPEEFAQTLFRILDSGTVPGFIRALENPPGRRPPQWLTDLNAWYVEMDDSSQQLARDLVRRSAFAGARAILAALDGTLAFDDATSSSRLELYYVGSGERVLLNDYDVISLDDELGVQAEGLGEQGPPGDS